MLSSSSLLGGRIGAGKAKKRWIFQECAEKKCWDPGLLLSSLLKLLGNSRLWKFSVLLITLNCWGQWFSSWLGASRSLCQIGLCRTTLAFYLSSIQVPTLGLRKHGWLLTFLVFQVWMLKSLVSNNSVLSLILWYTEGKGTGEIKKQKTTRKNLFMHTWQELVEWTLSPSGPDCETLVHGPNFTIMRLIF